MQWRERMGQLKIGLRHMKQSDALALVAHDAKKADMADFVATHRAILAPLHVVRHRHHRRAGDGTLPGPLGDAPEKRTRSAATSRSAR